jgi:hydroxymethylbilane synthase
MMQTNWVVHRLHQQWPDLDIQIEQIHTTGDKITSVPLVRIGGDGVFVTEIERALTEKRIDLAVHSLKDLPTVQPPGLCVVVLGPREDVRDALISRHDLHIAMSSLSMKTSFDKQVSSMRVGTCSLRRTAQILALSQDVQILPLRGNVDTRLRKLEAGDYDSIVLAAAGLRRLYTQEVLRERFGDHVYYLPIEMMMPAPGQGALALECREDSEMLALLAPLQDLSLQAATTAERMFMRHLGAGCYLPVAAYGAVVNDMLTLRGLVISLDGRQQVRVEQSVPWTPISTIEDAERLGVALAEQAMTQGADEIVRRLKVVREQSVEAQLKGNGGLRSLPLAGKRVLVTRTREQASALSERLRSVGADPVEFPTIQIVPPQDWGEIDAALRRLYGPQEEGYDWLIFTSTNGVSIFFQHLEQLGYRCEDLQTKQQVRIATIGPATAATLERYHVQADLVPEEYIAEGITAALLKDAQQRGKSLTGQRILLARAAEARKVLVTDLEQAGVQLDEVAVYYTFPVASNDSRGQEVLQLLHNGQLDIVTFTSSSTVRNFVAWLKNCGNDDVLRQARIASIGPITSQTARELGLHVDVEAKEFTIDGLVDAIIQHEGVS